MLDLLPGQEVGPPTDIFRLGLELYLSGKDNLAAEALQDQIALDPSFVVVHDGLGLDQASAERTRARSGTARVRPVLEGPGKASALPSYASMAENSRSLRKAGGLSKDSAESMIALRASDRIRQWASGG